MTESTETKPETKKATKAETVLKEKATKNLVPETPEKDTHRETTKVEMADGETANGGR